MRGIPRYKRQFRQIIFGAGVLIFLVGAGSGADTLFDLPIRMSSWVDGLPQMSLPTAICLMLDGLCNVLLAVSDIWGE